MILGSSALELPAYGQLADTNSELAGSGDPVYNAWRLPSSAVGRVPSRGGLAALKQALI